MVNDFCRTGEGELSGPDEGAGGGEEESSENGGEGGGAAGRVRHGARAAPLTSEEGGSSLLSAAAKGENTSSTANCFTLHTLVKHGLYSLIPAPTRSIMRANPHSPTCQNKL